MGYSSNDTHSNRLYLGMVRANEKQIKFLYSFYKKSLDKL